MEDDADAGDVGDDTAVEEIGREELLPAPLLSAEEVVLTNVANGGPGMMYGASGSVYAYEIRQSPIRSRSQREVKMPPIMTHIEEDSGVSRVVRPWKATIAAVHAPHASIAAIAAVSAPKPSIRRVSGAKTTIRGVIGRVRGAKSPWLG